jgi:hypothetical protein
VDYLYSDVVGEYWPPDRGMIARGYVEVVLPFTHVEPPTFAMQKEWTVDDALGYLRTWSATRGYIKAHGHDPVATVEEELRAVWGPGPRLVSWPLILKVSRKALSLSA